MERSSSNGGSAPLMARVTTFSSDLPRGTTLVSDAASTPSTGNNTRSRRATGELLSSDPARSAAHPGARAFGQGYEPDIDSEDDIEYMPLTPPTSGHPVRSYSEDIASFVQETLPAETFTEAGLVEHLKRIDDTRLATAIALDDLWVRRAELNPATVASALESQDDEPGPYTNSTYEVYDVLRDGSAVREPTETADSGDGVLDAPAIWESIKTVNPKETAVGRMTFLREPSPLMLGTAHMVMAKHFDMDELVEQLVTTNGNKGKSKAFMSRAFETAELRRRSFFFVFKYHTVLGDGLRPAPWQQYDNRSPDHRAPGHIDIAECSSVLALSLGGPHMKMVEGRQRRTKRNTRKGYVYDPFAPWHLLSIQCFPDDEHTMWSDEDSGKQFINGPYAFLDALVTEYRDAVKRYMKLNELITKLITPPSDFMFNGKLRDKLLFEDQHFTYSRRYFWAYNTLGVINDGIKSMISAYLETFNSDFWAGRHQTLWPHPKPDSSEGRAYEFRMSSLRQELERAISDLHAMQARNGRTRSEIRSLREQLFSGSSVKESRRAIEQGDNIKILTGVSMIFLPLTFVTSVFGITEFTISANDWRFPVTMICVCVPFFVIIFFLQTRRGMHAFKRCGRLLGRLGNRNPRRPDAPRLNPMQLQLQRQSQAVHNHHAAARKRPLRRTQSGGLAGHGGGVLAPEKGADRLRRWWPLANRRPRAAARHDPEIGKGAG